MLNGNPNYFTLVFYIIGLIEPLIMISLFGLLGTVVIGAGTIFAILVIIGYYGFYASVIIFFLLKVRNIF